MAVVVVRKEGTAVEPAQGRLHGYPFHKAVKRRVSGVYRDGQRPLPIRFGSGKCGLEGARPEIWQRKGGTVAVLPVDGQCHYIGEGGTRCQREISKLQCRHSLVAVQCGAGEERQILSDQAGIVKGTAFADEILDRKAAPHRKPTGFIGGKNAVADGITLVAPLVKC